MVVDDGDMIAVSPATLVKISLLERRKYVIDALEFIYKQRRRGITPDISILSSRVIALFFELYEELERFYKEKFKELEKEVMSEKALDLENAVKKINRWFDEKRLTRIDTVQRYDSTMAEIENLAKGL